MQIMNLPFTALLSIVGYLFWMKIFFCSSILSDDFVSNLNLCVFSLTNFRFVRVWLGMSSIALENPLYANWIMLKDVLYYTSTLFLSLRPFQVFQCVRTTLFHLNKLISGLQCLGATQPDWMPGWWWQGFIQSQLNRISLSCHPSSCVHSAIHIVDWNAFSTQI